MRRKLGVLGGLAAALLAACTALTGVGAFEVVPDEERTDASGSPDGSAGGDGTAPPVDAAQDTVVTLDAGFDACSATTDISTDPLHCGRCNHTCLGATCTVGRCGVVKVIGDLPQRGGLAIAGGKIFVSMASSIRRFEIDGGSPVDVVNAVNPHYLTADATYLYFVDRTDDTVKRWPLAGGLAETVVPNAGATGVGVSPTHLYFTHYIFDGGVERVQLDGGNRQLIFEPYNHPEEVEYSPGEMIIGGDGVNELAAFANDGFGAKRVLSTGGGPCTFAVKDGVVYFGEQQTQKVMRMPIAGGAKEELAADSGVQVGVAVTDDAVFWREYNDGGSIWRVAR